MDTTKITDEINQERRRFFGTAAMTHRCHAVRDDRFCGSSTHGGKNARNQARNKHVVRSTEADRCRRPECGLRRGRPRRMGPLSFSCMAGPTTFTALSMSPLCSQRAGYRVIVPHLRGYGTTRFLSSAAVRNGQPSALAVDLKDFLDALKIEKPILAGFDWGARTANIFAALWPERSKATVSVSGYLIGNQAAGQAAAAAGGGASMVVPVLFRHRPRPGRL